MSLHLRLLFRVSLNLSLGFPPLCEACCSLLLLHGIVYWDLNLVQAIFYKSVYCLLKSTGTLLRSWWTKVNNSKSEQWVVLNWTILVLTFHNVNSHQTSCCAVSRCGNKYSSMLETCGQLSGVQTAAVLHRRHAGTGGSHLHLHPFHFWCKTLPENRLIGVVVKASASRAEDLGSIHACGLGIFPGWVLPVT